MVLSFDVALGAVLQHTGDIALHHIGTIAPEGGKHSNAVSPPAPGAQHDSLQSPGAVLNKRSYGGKENTPRNGFSGNHQP